ncbi:hypothetical protein TKK_0001720 [Trichogramma kaykai]
MVMEASPSPQCVGREFVRQYYTLLNRAPTHLHRFYNNHSSFVHGGLESNRESLPAIGQKQIHQKIQALNFQDCHAKINQVDSQSTLGNGVVVQVSGELSNAGHPMRRFTQTFVLAAQGPTKYYVHNDIFRYQDFGYGDEEEEEEVENDANVNETVEREEDVENTRQEAEKDDQQNQIPQIATKISNDQIGQNQLQQQPPQLTQQQPMYYAIPPQAVHPPTMQVTINGSVHEDSSIIAQQPHQQPQSLQQQYATEKSNEESFQSESEHSGTNQQQTIKTDSHVASEESHEPSETEQNYIPSVSETEPDQLSMQNVMSNGPKTYANLVKSFPTVGTTSPQTPKPSLSPPPVQNLHIEDRIPMHQQSTGAPLPASNNVPSNQHAHRMGGLQQQTQQQYQQRLPRTGGPMQRDGERRTSRPGGYTDAHQLFLGNLPHNASENDLRQVFERYGRVADLRVHSKPNGNAKGIQGQNNTRVPNYGFITFEDSTVVNKVLNDLPIYFPDQNGQKLNVEEKKVRPREGGSGRSNTSNDGNIRPLGTQQQQQRGPGGPGIMRGGQHGGTRGRGGFNRGGGESGRGGLRQSGGNPNSQNYHNRR